MNQKIRKIGLLGGDLRQLKLASLLAEEGYETAVWGFGSVMDREDTRAMLTSCVRCADWESAVIASDLILLPLPVSTDDVRLNTPLATSDCAIRLTEIVEKISPGSRVLGGKIPPLIRRLTAERGVRVYDYYESEALQIKNSIPTAEGALAIAIREIPVTVKGCRALITGYGRVGRTLAHKLNVLGAQVTVAARSVRDLAWSSSDGCTSLRLAEYKNEPIPSDIIFNTVPAMIFDETLLRKLPGNPVIVELASGCRGVDIASAGDRKIIAAEGLPGKMSPITAGEIIFDTVKEYLDNDEK